MNILDLEPDAFENALKELRLEAEQEQFLRDEYAKKNTLSGQMTGAFQEATKVPEGMIRANVVPMMKPEGMSGWDAITSGKAELALPGMLTGSVEEVGQAMTTAEKMTSGIGVTEEEMQQAANVVSGLGLTGAAGRAVTNAVPDPNTLYIFGGLGSARPPSKTFKRAEQLNSQGLAPQETWKDTGWWKNPEDDKWRFEIDDSDSEIAWDKVKPQINAQMKATGKVNIETTVGKVLKHDKLYEQYPELFDRKLFIKNLPDDSLGEFNPSTGALTLSPKLGQDKMRSVLLHEAQHFVQEKENFARGTNPSVYNTNPKVSALAKEALSAKQAWETAVSNNAPNDTLQRLLNDYVSAKAKFEGLRYRFYRGETGEIESRLVEERQDMRPLERGKVSPQESQQVMTQRETAEGYAPEVNTRNQKNIRDQQTPIVVEVGDNWSDEAKIFEVLSRDDDTRELLTLKPGDKITLPVGRDLVEGEFTSIGLAKDDSYNLFNLYPEVKTSTNEYPVITFKYPSPSGGMQNGFLGLGDYLGIMLGKQDTADLRFGRPQAPMVNISNSNSTNFAEGGIVEDTQMRRLMEEGGMTDDGMNVEPVTGNRVPPGSLASEVRDDIPAQLSEGEYVVPADVVRFFGVRFFEDLRMKAKQGLAQMDADGRIGGAPVDSSGVPLEEDLTPEEEQMLMEALGTSTGMAEGGVVEGNAPFDRTQFQLGTGMNIRSVKYFNPETKETRFFQFAGDTPLGLIPEGFVPWTADIEQQAKEEEVAPTPSTNTQTGTRKPANTVVTAGSTSQSGGAGYQSWADKNYDSITNDPYNFGLNALQDTSGQVISKGLLGVGAVTGAAPLAMVGAAVNSANKIQNIAEANAALQIMKAQGMEGTAEYSNLEGMIKSAASDIPVTQWGLLGTGNNYYDAIVKKQSDLTGDTGTARSTTGTTGGGTSTGGTSGGSAPAPKPASRSSSSSGLSGSEQLLANARANSNVSNTANTSLSNTDLKNVSATSNTGSTPRVTTPTATSNVGSTANVNLNLDRTATEDRRAVGGLMTKKKPTTKRKGLVS